jgi:hypothetical protein
MPFILADGIRGILQLRACDETAEIRRLVNDQVVKAAPESRNGSGVVLGHGKTKCDHHDQSCEVAKLKPTAVVRGAERSFRTKPYDHDGGEGKEHALAKKSELPDVLREQLCDEGGHKVQLAHSDAPFLQWRWRI